MVSFLIKTLLRVTLLWAPLSFSLQAQQLAASDALPADCCIILEDLQTRLNALTPEAGEKILPQTISLPHWLAGLRKAFQQSQNLRTLQKDIQHLENHLHPQAKTLGSALQAHLTTLQGIAVRRAVITLLLVPGTTLLSCISLILVGFPAAMYAQLAYNFVFPPDQRLPAGKRRGEKARKVRELGEALWVGGTLCMGWLLPPLALYVYLLKRISASIDTAIQTQAQHMQSVLKAWQAAHSSPATFHPKG